ncbi:hypothetical protein [Kitasatospora aureofaciens]|uniref:hypothetical protein n=1 Tax=Kitasatospora aureofaciens TaxID=1894 RepID=UPI001C46C65E|nr:hypothetical protein [Kitasatospora aureofaciens]MBV6699848.1 hypothetical protein [Kitasatospora aureofaciens]
MKDNRPVAIEITGLKPPTVFDLTPAALDAIWAAIRFLPLPRPQHNFLDLYLQSPCAERNITAHLATNPVLTLPVGEHELRIRWADSEEAPA